MTSLMKKIALLGVSAAVLATSFLPAEAMPLTARPEVKSDVQTVQYWRERDYYGGHRDGYYGGYRGHRERRDGYRYHNGYWFPLAAFATGAIVGGALSQPREVYRPRPVYREYRPVVRGGMSQSHVNWCYGRYRSYDAYSNTFQPYNGPRRTCYSPYG